MIDKEIRLTLHQTRRLLKVLSELDTYYTMHIEGDATKQELKFAQESDKVRFLLVKKFDKKIAQIEKQLKQQ
tara:strand:+ start:155 stop:370 length:216 start_codon:yes stop_codon:yes gene_type:complete